jgi:rubrerythrin
MDKRLIERAIESAKARQHKLEQDLARDISVKHRAKAGRQKEVADVTVIAVEKMMPKKPTYNGNNWYRCVNCCEVHKKQFEKDWYCPKCGQRIDWGE